MTTPHPDLVAIALRGIPTFQLIDNETRTVLSKWEQVGGFWISSHPACEECGYCRITEDKVPYGEGYETTFDSECTLGQVASHRPEQCPALQQLTEQEEA